MVGMHHHGSACGCHEQEHSPSAGANEAAAHQHNHVPTPSGKRLNLIILLTGVIMIAEAVGGYFSGSLALMADAGHMLTDFLALLVASAAMALGQRPADVRRTYGYRRLEILAALGNGVALVLVSGGILIEAVQRWLSPHPVNLVVMAGVAAVGLVSNVTGLVLLHGLRTNLNMRGAFLHILGDTLSSVGVIVVAGIIAVTGWTRIDALISVAIAIIIVYSSVALLREALDILLEAAPAHIDTEKVHATIVGVPGVQQVHDLHVWSIASGLAALSAHVVIKDPAIDHTRVLEAIQDKLRQEFAIEHCTLQIEYCANHGCGCCYDWHANSESSRETAKPPSTDNH